MHGDSLCCQPTPRRSPPGRIVRHRLPDAAVLHAEREAVFREELVEARLSSKAATSTIEYRSADGRFRATCRGWPRSSIRREGRRHRRRRHASGALPQRPRRTTIPIVIVGVADPRRLGASLTSLARPGGNVTGNSVAATDVVGKQLELLRELLPGVRRVAALWNPTNTVFAEQQLKEAKAAADEARNRASDRSRPPIRTRSKKRSKRIAQRVDAVLSW